MPVRPAARHYSDTHSLFYGSVVIRDKGRFDMVDAVSTPDGRPSLALRLAKETGITEAQALDLVVMLGANWSSLVREARFLNSRPPRFPTS
jgi:hypothetical protein